MTGRSRQQQSVTLLGVGDVGGRWHMYDTPGNTPETMYKYVAPVFHQADIVFANLETASWTDKEEVYQLMVRRYKTRRPNADDTQVKIDVMRGDYSPYLAKCGVNVVSLAGSHTMDFGLEPLLETIENLKRNGIASAGAGRDIQEARTPAIVERKGVRVAVLSYISGGDPGGMAGEHSAGMAPMRAHTFYVNERWGRDPGLPPETKTHTVSYREDLEALLEDVRKAKAQADVVVLALHWGVNWVRGMIADYQIDVAHAAINAGADLILGHHPKILKGIEVYKGKVCFYGLCNFLQPRPANQGFGAYAPEEIRARLYNYHYVNDDPEWFMYSYDPDARMSMVAKCLITKEGVQRVSYLPVWINGQSQPRILSSGEPQFEQTVSYVRDITEDYFKTSFRVEGNEVVVNSP